MCASSDNTALVKLQDRRHRWMDLSACDKLHVEGNLQGPLNFSIAFIPLSCSRRDEMGLVSFFLFFSVSLIHGGVPAGAQDKRPALPDGLKHSSPPLLFSSSFFQPPEESRRLKWREGADWRRFTPAAALWLSKCHRKKHQMSSETFHLSGMKQKLRIQQLWLLLTSDCRHRKPALLVEQSVTRTKAGCRF